MESENVNTNEVRDHIKQCVGLLVQKGEIKGKEEMFNKLSPLVNQAIEERDKVVNSLKDHVDKEKESLAEIHSHFEEARLRRDRKAAEFCKDKTSEQLKEWLADQPVPYNAWKAADHDTLIKLALDVYDEEEY
jgi:hypothetical protein